MARTPPVEFHTAALRHAGFIEVGTAWQMFDNYVVFGRKPELRSET